MNKVLATLLLPAALLLLSGICTAQESGYVATPVTISKDKVRNNGKLYYSHVVLERQTLYSISKAYGVSLQEIYDANQTLNLETEGLKKFQIILIPIKDNIPVQNEAEAQQAEPAGTAAAAVTPAAPAATEQQQTAAFTKKASKVDDKDYFIHTVKWYEDLDAIAAKYGIPAETIMAFNGMESPAVTKKMKLKIPVHPDEILPETPSEDAEAAVEEEEPTLLDRIEDWAEEAEDFLFGGKKEVKAALVLPFDAKGQPGENNFDFYCGTLLAVRDLESEGIHIDLDVIDSAHKSVPATDSELADRDIILGPISTTDLGNTLSVCPSDAFVVSPLEPKAVTLANTYSNLIQAPASADLQCQDLVNWLKEEFKPGDKVILFTEKGATPTANATSIIRALASSGLTYSTVNYGILEGRNIINNLEKIATPDHTNRIVVASESEAFVNDVIRNVNLMIFRQLEVALYCPSKVRSFDTIEVDHFHDANMHVSLGYYIDYESPRVQRFLMTYRAFFQCEPGPFAFQGYDTAYNFLKMHSKYGRSWSSKITEIRETGLQSDFLFDETETGSFVNKAVRRIVYEDDYKTRLVK